MDHFLECILQDREPEPGGLEGLWAMRVLEAAYRSASTGQAVAL
jgi:predicted dehydrogenase